MQHTLPFGGGKNCISKMAQQAATADLCCLKTETELDRIASGLYTSLQVNGRTFGTAAALEDNSGNTSNTIFQPSRARPDGSGPVTAKVKYMIPECGETADVIPDFDCTDRTDDEITYGYEEVFLDQGVGESFSMSANTYDTRCEVASEELAKILVQKALSMRSKYNRKLTTLLAASVGGTYVAGQSGDPLADVTTGVLPAKLKLFRAGTSGEAVPQPMAIQDLEYQYQRMAANLATTPVLIHGSKAVGAYLNANTIYGANIDGLDPGSTTGRFQNAYLDWQLPSTLSAGPASRPLISFLPGSVELLEFYEFDNPNKVVTNSNGRSTWAPVQFSNTLTRQKVDIGTPIFGREWIVDLEIRYDECDNRVHYTMRKDFGLFNIPEDAFCDGANWNYKLMWDIVSEVYTPADALG